MRALITAASLVLILTTYTASAQSQTEAKSGGSTPRPEAGRPRVEIDRMNVYVCPRHPEAKATWPAQCPMCHMRMQRQSSVEGRRRMGMRNRMEWSGQGISPLIRMQYRMMMNTGFHPYNPEVLLGSSRMLGLSPQQVRQLRMIAMRARRAAMGVLTEAQRRRLMPLEGMMNAPSSMARMHERMMGGSGMGAMGPGRDPSAYGYDPGSARARPMDEDDEFGEGGFGEGEEGFGGDEGFGFGQGFGDEGFGDDEGFGFGEGFGNEGFGGEGFGREGFGDEGLGREGFGNEGFGGEGFGREGFGDEGFGREGFGRDEGFGNNEFRGEKSFGNEQRFGGDEGFRGDEGPRGKEESGGERSGTAKGFELPSRGR